MIKTPMPYRISAARSAQRLLVSSGNDDETADADLGQCVCLVLGFTPNLPVAIGETASFARGVQANDVEASARGAFGAFYRVNAIPDRRMRLLQRFNR